VSLPKSLGTQQIFVATVMGSGTPTPIATAATNVTPPVSPTPTPTPPPPPTPPAFTGETRITAGKGKKKTVVGFALKFSSALQASVAASTVHYRVVQPGPTRKAAPRVIAVKTATLGPGGTSITLTLGKYLATKSLSLTATGLMGANGAAVSTVTTNL